MTILLIGLVALVAILASLSHTIASDGYGVRPPPSSHHDVDELDSWGLPTKYVGPR